LNSLKLQSVGFLALHCYRRRYYSCDILNISLVSRCPASDYAVDGLAAWGWSRRD
jgi:hypothetical protein